MSTGQRSADKEVVSLAPSEDSSAILPADAAPSICRVCWGEADDEPGGALVSPCECRGSMATIHQHCLQEWAALCRQRSPYSWSPLLCEICKSPLRDPSLEANPATRQPRGNLTLHRLATLHSNPVINAYLLGATLSGMLHSARGSLSSLSDVPRLFLEARKNPFAALAPQWPQLILAGFGSRLMRLPSPVYGACGTIYLFGAYLDAAARDMWEGISSLPLPLGVRNVLALPLWPLSAVGVALAAPPFALVWGTCGAQAGLVRGVCRWLLWSLGGGISLLSKAHGLVRRGPR